MLDTTKDEEKVSTKDLLKNSIVAFIPMAIIITLLRDVFTGFLPPLITIIVTTGIVGTIREKYNVQFTKKTIAKIVLLELAIVISILALIFLLLSPNENSVKETSVDKSSRFSTVQDNLYRNTKYNFRIKFPDDWTISPGDGLNIVQKASNGWGTIAVTVKELDDLNVSSIKEIAETEEFADGIITLLRGTFSDVKLINYGETKIDNRPAYWIEYSATYQALDNVVKMTSIAYYIVKDDFYYGIEGGTLSESYDSIKPILKNSVRTFVIEK